MKKKIVLFYGREIGKKILDILRKDKNLEIIYCIKVKCKKGPNKISFDKNQKQKSWNNIYKKLKKSDNFTIITAWWGFIIPSKILNLSNKETINLHPSFLPFGKGKYSNIWAILNNEPYGSTLSSLGNGIDNGKIYVQKKINYDLSHTAENLYDNSLKNLIDLFKKNYKRILSGKIKLKKIRNKGSYYSSKKIINIRKLYLGKKYYLSDLIKRINACTFSGYPKAYFKKNKKKYTLELKVSKRD